jgi:hypothetical protein
MMTRLCQPLFWVPILVSSSLVLVMSFPVVCGTSHNSSRLESYGHEKLETPGLGNGPKFV